MVPLPTLLLPRPSQARRPDAAQGPPDRFEDRATLSGRAGPWVSATASAAVPAKATTTTTRDAIWRYLVIVDPILRGLDLPPPNTALILFGELRGIPRRRSG